MTDKIFSKEGSRLRTFAGDNPHEWILKDQNNVVFFKGSAEEMNVHTSEMLDKGEYLYRAKRGRRKK